MHNHRSLLNMDISGGTPAVIIKMLVASDVGRIKLLPALPAAWPSGRIEGVLCRGVIEIQSLQWDGKQVNVTLRSAKSQNVLLELPTEITQLSVTDGTAKATPATRANQRTIALPDGQPVTIHVQLN
jgi:alpha-L-fucosidase 2